MAKYDVHFSCGHTERKELFGPTEGRRQKIAYWEERGICTQCWREQQDIEASIDCDEITMSYREYKTSYAECKTKSGSYDGKAKTIVVYVPKSAVGE